MLNGSVTVKLVEPIQFGSETISELVVRKPKAKDFRRMPGKPGMGDMLDLLGALTGQPKAVIDELCLADMTAATGVLEVFMPGGRETGTEQ